MLLVTLRILSTVLLIGLTRTGLSNMIFDPTRGTSLIFWVFVNGSLWLFGSIWGLRQISRGDCWLMRVLGEGIDRETAGAK
jgi:hypothetical protein